MDDLEAALHKKDCIDSIGVRYNGENGRLAISAKELYFFKELDGNWNSDKQWASIDIISAEVNKQFWGSTLILKSNQGQDIFRKISPNIDISDFFFEKISCKITNVITSEMSPEYSISGISDVGLVRALNEDNWMVTELSPNIQLIAVADGMGGHDKGEVASEMAVTILKNETHLMVQNRSDLSLDKLKGIMLNCFQDANNSIQEYSSQQGSDMGTTMVGALVIDQKMALIANVGDSRGYLFREGVLFQLTKDHSLVQRMVDHNQLTPEEARHHPHSNILMRTVGTERNVRIDIFPIELLSNDVILLCSDGLWGELEDEEMQKVLLDFPNLDQCAEELVRLTKLCGAKDNITHVLYRMA